MGRLFGTDGIRGLANRVLTVDIALRAGVAAARHLVDHSPNRSRRPVAVVGRDTRASGEMLEAALVAGFTSQGVDVHLVGVLPTPAVAYATAANGADLGAVISASHNPMPDNGIKFFGPGGLKLSDADETHIEVLMSAADYTGPIGAAVGRRSDLHEDAASRYVGHLLTATPHELTGLTVVVDAANGAAYEVAAAAYRQAGATVISLHDQPNGYNINEGCGSTHIESLQAAVLAHGADLGIAHDGDADRCLAVDETGALIDGDKILAILAGALHRKGELKNNAVVATVMSNLGLHVAMRKQNIELITTPVGDRYVLEELHRSGYSLGGEQSGHIILPQYATTGDGILTALRLMAEMVGEGKPLSALGAVMTVLPQVLVNVPVENKSKVASDAEVQRAVAEAESELGEDGRVLLRPSGTEQLVRVMVEATQFDRAESIAARIAVVVSQAH